VKRCSSQLHSPQTNSGSVAETAKCRNASCRSAANGSVSKTCYSIQRLLVINFVLWQHSAALHPCDGRQSTHSTAVPTALTCGSEIGADLQCNL